MQLKRVYLDAQQWSYLANPPDRTDLGLDRAKFERASRIGAFEVVASLDLVQEAIVAIHRGRALVESIVRPMLQFAGPRILQPLERRHALEISHGGQLPLRNRYLGASERDLIPSLLESELELLKVATMVEAQKRKFKADQENIRAMMTAELAEAGFSTSPQVLLEWFNSHDREDWCRSIVERGEELGHYAIPEGQTWNYRRVPSAYTFLCYQQARVVQTLGERRKIKESDLADAHHAASGPYYDILVTDDEVLRLALALLPTKTFTAMTSAQFSAEFIP